MANAMKKMVVGSMAAAGLVAVVAALDLALGFPYNRAVVLDVLFLLGAGTVIYMGWEAYRDLR